MTELSSKQPGSLKIIGLLLIAAQKRAIGRRGRRSQLLAARAGKARSDWSGVGFFCIVVLTLALHVLAAWFVEGAVIAAQRFEAEQRGAIVVSARFAGRLQAASQKDSGLEASRDEIDRALAQPYRWEANNIALQFGGDKDEIAERLRDEVRDHGGAHFVEIQTAAPGAKSMAPFGGLAAMLGSLALLCWIAAMVFQGEGLELDAQRRRHPMWEWLFSHPAPARAIFLAEMLAPIAANPVYYGAPLFAGFLYGFVYGPLPGLFATFLIGFPIAVAASCLGKALEMGLVLRLSPRSRGAFIGLMGWVGFVSMMGLFIGSVSQKKVAAALAEALQPFAYLPWPWLGLFLGQRANGTFSFALGMLTCWVLAGAISAGSLWFAIWAARQGLGGPASAETKPRGAGSGGANFGREPLFRKELLWFTRDRSAIVQAILIPLTMAAFQLFSFGGFVTAAGAAWNYLCGAAILFGTYFLMVLGPKSLASEGAALWISLTWPQGLESLLRAKAWLWSMIATAVTIPIFVYAAWLYPDSSWKIALAGVGWFAFARSLSTKTVTLANVTPESGEPEKIPLGRRAAVYLGAFTFAIGMLTQQWALVVMGVVYSIMTAEAMWESFRARLPFLHDPWSEKLPSSPSLTQAMIAISCIAEGAAFAMGLTQALLGGDNSAAARAVGCAVSAIVVALVTVKFLGNRDVRLRDVCFWGSAEGRQSVISGVPAGGKAIRSMLLAAALGAVLGAFGLGYLALLREIPAPAEILIETGKRAAEIPRLRELLFVTGVVFAPFAEEFLFRGLLYRALDRSWGGWRAMVGGAAFFAIYHPFLSWPPAMLLGMVNAWLFKATGWLAPAVLLHLIYNAMVLS